MHKARRARLAADVNAGRMTCARCGQPIEPGQPWALDHRDDRKGYVGPSHQSCNAAAGAQRRHELRRANGRGVGERPRLSSNGHIGGPSALATTRHAAP
jgi:hypothetical protein